MRRIYIGLDLAAKPSRCTGFVAIEHKQKLDVVEAMCLGLDDEIVYAVTRFENPVVAIDAPLTTSDKPLRSVDRKMILLGYRVLPPSLPHMRMLTSRAISIATKLREYGATVIETHPRSVLKSSKCSSVEDLAKKLGIELKPNIARNKDIRDAFLAAVAALCFDFNCSNPIQESDGVIWLVKELCLYDNLNS